MTDQPGDEMVEEMWRHIAGDVVSKDDIRDGLAAALAVADRGTLTYAEWRVTGSIDGEPYEFTWSPFRNPHLGDPEKGARGFLALIAKTKAELGIRFDLTLQRRAVTMTDWEGA